MSQLSHEQKDDLIRQLLFALKYAKDSQLKEISGKLGTYSFDGHATRFPNGIAATVKRAIDDTQAKGYESNY